MKVPKTTGELCEALANIMAGAINGDVRMEEGRLALNAATRIVEVVQAETRARKLAFEMGSKFPELGQMALNGKAVALVESKEAA